MNEWKSKTNAQLYYASKLLSAYKGSRGGAQVGISAALRNGAALSIKEAWLCWLNELGVILNCQNETFTCLQGLLDHPVANLPDVQGLKSLKEEPNDWLGDLLLLVDDIGRSIQIDKVHADEGNDNPLKMHSIDDGVQTEYDKLFGLIDQLKSYIQGVRAQHVEW